MRRVHKYLLFLLIFLMGCSDRVPTSMVETEKMAQSGRTDVERVVQLILDYPDLQQYYHETMDGRKPLYILQTPPFGDQPALVKFGIPVRYKQRNELSGSDYEAYIEFMKLEVGEYSADIAFTYPIEGLFVEVELSKSGDRWHVAKYSIAEH